MGSKGKHVGEWLGLVLVALFVGACLYGLAAAVGAGSRGGVIALSCLMLYAVFLGYQLVRRIIRNRRESAAG